MQVNISSKTLLYFLLVFIGLGGFAITFAFSAPNGFYAAIILAAIAGFGVAANVYRTKQRKEQLVCPTGSDCNAVITSRYAEFLGVSLEYWGMLYYGVVAVVYTALLFASGIFTPAMMIGTVILSTFAGMFSLYLLFVQAVLIRKWCIWCILSALLSLAICIFSFVSLDSTVAFLARFDHILFILRSLGLALGVGGVTATVVQFFQFLDDDKIDEKELSAIQGVFELVWIGLGLVLVGQSGLYVLSPGILAAMPSFIAQTIALGLAVIAGAVLMIIYAPFLAYLPFTQSVEEATDASLANLRRPTLIAGAVALVSWYFAFLVRYFTQTPVWLLLMTFAIALVLAVVAALGWDDHLASPTEPTTE